MLQCRADSSPAGDQLGQSLDRSDMAKRVLVNFDVVARNPCVDGSFENETQQRVERMIRLMEGEHGGAVGLFLEFVVALGARPQRLPDRWARSAAPAGAAPATPSSGVRRHGIER
jgi:hypothetical protein